MTEKPDRIERRTVLRDWPVLLLLALDIAFGLWALPRLPAQVPMHWGLSGQPDHYGPAWQGALLFPVLATGIYVLMLFLPQIDPRRRNYELFPGVYRLARWLIPLLLVALHLMMVLGSLGWGTDPVRMIRVALPLLFIILGNYLGQIRQNYFFGLRTPWTLASEEVWNRTHRAAGRLWVVCGLLMLAAAFLPPAWGFGVFIGLVAVMVAMPLIHSYLLYRKTTRE